jgi:hypothetical protein
MDPALGEQGRRPLRELGLCGDVADGGVGRQQLRGGDCPPDRRWRVLARDRDPGGPGHHEVRIVEDRADQLIVKNLGLRSRETALHRVVEGLLGALAVQERPERAPAPSVKAQKAQLQCVELSSSLVSMLQVQQQ